MYPPELVKVPVRELAKHEGGKMYEEFADIKVAAPFEGIDEKLQLSPPEVLDDLEKLLKIDAEEAGRYGDDGSYTHLLTVRRVKHVYNSSCHDFPKNPPGNPAYLHPDDIASLGFSSGQGVQLSSENASINVIIEADSALRRGVVSMSHCFGGDPDSQESLHAVGANASKLIAVDRHYDPLMGMPRMTGFAVKFSA